VARLLHRLLVFVSLAGVSALGIGVPLVARRELPAAPAEDSVGAMDARLAPLRQYLPEGTRLHWLVPVSNAMQESGTAFVAQYALAPLVVLPARQGDCDGGAKCPLISARIVGTDVADPQLLEALRVGYGLIPFVVTYQAVLLGRAVP